MANDAVSNETPEGTGDQPNPDETSEFGKYENLEQLKKGQLEGETHIQTLQSELAELRKSQNFSANMESFLEKLRADEPTQTAPTSPAPVANHEESVPADLSAQVDALVSQKVTQIANKSQRVQNYSAAKEALEKMYGSDYGAEVHKARVALGETEDFMNKLAADNPQALIKLVSVMSPVQETSHVNPNVAAPVSTAPSFATDNSTRNEAYYTALRKKDHSLYMTHEVQNAMQRDSQRMGEAFFTKK